MTAAAKANRHPILGRALALVLACLAVPVAAQPRAGTLDAFRSRHGAAWSLATDPATSRPRDLRGGAVALGASARTGDRDAILADVRAFLAEAGPLLGLDPTTLALREPGVILASGDFGAVHFDVAPSGVPVEGADVTVAFSRGSILAVHVVGAARVSASVATRPSLTSEQAFTVALEAAGFAARDVAATEPRLAFLPWRGGHVLAWRVTLIRPLAGTRHVAWVDARDGALLALTDETVSACAAPPPGGVPRRVVAGVRANRADDVERQELLSFVSVGAARSDVAGLVPPQPAGATATLEGPVVRVECVECASPAAPLAEMDSRGDLDFGAGGIDASGNGFATPADRSAYFHAERVHRQAGRWLAMPWLSQPLTVRTNLPNSCNAYWNGVALNFFRSSPDCANTGEIRDVVSHEWGHGLDENDGLPPPGVSVDAATGEAVGDIVAILRSRDACIGESFFLDPADWPSASCSGVRDLDELAPGQRRGVLTSATVAATCPPSAFYRGVAGREGHCEGEILGQTFWHLVRTLSTGTSYGDGSALAAGLGDELAWQVAEALFYRSRSVLASYAPSSMQSIGMPAHEAFLLADDEGDGLASGTPHAWAINDAFVHHGIDEVLPPTSAACALAPPVVTTTTVFDASTGRPFVRVSWTDAGPGAARHDVLRDDADGGGLAPVASPFGPGAGSMDDRGLLPGRAARYAVVASGATGCQSVGEATAPAAPALRVAALRVDDSVLGNADARLSAGETADILVDLANDGAADATAVTATLDDVDPGVSILAGGPLSYGRIAAGATVTAPAAFRVNAAAGADSSVTIEVAGEAAEGCLRAIWVLPIARPELVVAARIVDDAAGDADGAWDPGESIDLFVSLTDVGEEAALSVSGTVSFRGAPPAGVTITRNAAAWGDIAVAATVPCAAPGFGLAATAAVPRGTLVRLDLALTIAGVPHRVVPVDVLIGGVAEGLWDPLESTCRHASLSIL